MLYYECRYAECRCAECRYAECRYAVCHYAECHYAECRYAECHYTESRGALELGVAPLKKFRALSKLDSFITNRETFLLRK